MNGIIVCFLVQLPEFLWWAHMPSVKPHYKMDAVHMQSHMLFLRKVEGNSLNDYPYLVTT